MTQIHLYATFTARPSCTDAVATALSNYGDAVSAEPGTVEFRAYVLRDDPRRFHVHEIYVDEAAFRVHVASDLAESFNAGLLPLVEGSGSHLTFLTPVGADSDQNGER